MPIPDYLVDQNYDYIKARGYSWKDFSPEQILNELRQRDIRISLRGSKKEIIADRDFDTIDCKVPLLGVKSRWEFINPLNSKYYKAYTIQKNFRAIYTSTYKTGEIEIHSIITNGNLYRRNSGRIFVGNREKNKRKKFKIRKHLGVILYGNV